MEIHSDDRGLKGIELSAALTLLGLLVALAIPLGNRIGGQVDALSEAAEARAEFIDSFVDVPEPEVAGIQLLRSTDGAECRWLTAESGTVRGVWNLGGRSVSGIFSSVPEVCPNAAEVAAAGFGS